MKQSSSSGGQSDLLHMEHRPTRPLFPDEIAKQVGDVLIDEQLHAQAKSTCSLLTTWAA